MENKKIIESLLGKFPKQITEINDPCGDLVIEIDKSILIDVMQFLKDKPFEFAMLLDLTCIDYIGQKPRFVMVYHLFSLSTNLRIRIKAGVQEEALRIDTLSDIWKNANWLEREVYDMFGIEFVGHPYMKRLFMYDGFEGYPLRKDFPLRHRQPCVPLRNKNDN